MSDSFKYFLSFCTHIVFIGLSHDVFGLSWLTNRSNLDLIYSQRTVSSKWKLLFYLVIESVLIFHKCIFMEQVWDSL